MHVVVTGINGFLGGHVAKALLEQGALVTGLVRPGSNRSRLDETARGLRLVTLRPGNREADLDTAMDAFQDQKPDAVLHLATVYGRGNVRLSAVAEANLLLPCALLERFTGGGPFVMVDSFYSLAHGDPVGPLASYNLSKAQARQWGRLAADHLGTAFINARLHHLYGPGDAPEKFIPWLVGNLIGNVDRLELTSGEQVRDFIFVEDAAQALALLAGRTCARGEKLDLDIGCGRSVPLKTLVLAAKKAAGADTELVFGARPHPPFEIMQAEADIRLLQGMGWRPRHSLEQGLLATVEAAKAAARPAARG